MTQEVPTISVIEDETVKELVKLCGSPKAPEHIVRGPSLVDIGDSIYVIFTDGGSAVLVDLDLEDLPDLPSSPRIQREFVDLGSKFEEASEYLTHYTEVDIGELLAWCMEGTEPCPKCKGDDLTMCLFPRFGTEMSKREAPEVFNAHTGLIGSVYVDRRRIKVPLDMLGVTEGEINVSLLIQVSGDGVVQKSGIALISDAWRIYVGGVVDDGPKDENIPVFAPLAADEEPEEGSEDA